ncbi:GspH/FimT family pseudopilin (plasmid) [Marinovum sp. KMM 9989]
MDYAPRRGPLQSQGAATLETGDGFDTDAGFSLIELVIVTSIIATLSLTAVLSLRLAPESTPAARLEDFARGLRYLQAEALFTDRSFGVGFAADGWEVMVFSEEDRTWLRRDPKALHGAGDWGGENRLSLWIEEQAVSVRPVFPEEAAPDVFLLPSGETTPFQVSIRDATDRRASCVMQSYGELQCQRGS